MTEAEWLACEDAKEMNRCLHDRFNAHRRKICRRKYRLFGCAVARRWWDLLTDPRSRHAVEFAEQLADGRADAAGLDAVHEDARKALSEVDSQAVGSGRGPSWDRRESPAASAAWGATSPQPGACAYAHWAMRCYIGGSDVVAHREWRDELRALSQLFHDIFGNPFRPVAADPAWLTSTVVQLAQGIYDDRAFDRMPVLADALQDAGCDHPDILAHCRGPGPHARGCWVVDLLLGRQ